MAKQVDHRQTTGPSELTLDELDNISAGHGVAIPPEGFDKLEQNNRTTLPPKPVNPMRTKII